MTVSSEQIKLMARNAYIAPGHKKTKMPTIISCLLALFLVYMIIDNARLRGELGVIRADIRSLHNNIMVLSDALMVEREMP